jgi:riboflavin kinase/FMN adenylyltransferase
MVAYPTDEALLRLTPQEFFSRIVREQLQARAMVEGPNFYFGQNRSGNVEVLRRLTADAGIMLDIVEPLVIGGEIVSSSRVRRLIGAGDVEPARQILTQPYRIRGMVVHGAARGNKIGFPTANVTSIDTLLPAAGVYAGRVLFEGQYWPAAINIGPNPTFGEQAMKVEAHLIGWHGSLYGQPLAIDFLRRLRDIQRFATVAALVEQMHRDVAAAEQEAMGSGTRP